MKLSVQRFHNLIYLGTKSMSAKIVYVVTLYFVSNHLAWSQTTESFYTLIEPRPFILRHILSDSSGFSTKGVDSIVKVVSQVEEIGPFNPRPKTLHKTTEISLSFLSCIFQSVFPSLALAENGDPVISKPTNNSAQRAPSGSVERNLGGIKLNIGHVILWGLISGFINFMIGWGAFSHGRRTAYKNTIPNRPQHQSSGVASD